MDALKRGIDRGDDKTGTEAVGADFRLFPAVVRPGMFPQPVHIERVISVPVEFLNFILCRLIQIPGKIQNVLFGHDQAEVVPAGNHQTKRQNRARGLAECPAQGFRDNVDVGLFHPIKGRKDLIIILVEPDGNFLIHIVEIGKPDRHPPPFLPFIFRRQVLKVGEHCELFCRRDPLKIGGVNFFQRGMFLRVRIDSAPGPIPGLVANPAEAPAFTIAELKLRRKFATLFTNRQVRQKRSTVAPEKPLFFIQLVDYSLVHGAGGRRPGGSPTTKVCSFNNIRGLNLKHGKSNRQLFDNLPPRFFRPGFIREKGCKLAAAGNHYFAAVLSGEARQDNLVQTGQSLADTGNRP